MIDILSGRNFGDSAVIDGLSVSTGHFQFTPCNQQLPRRRVIHSPLPPPDQSATSLPASENIQVTPDTVVYKSFPVQSILFGRGKRKKVLIPEVLLLGLLGNRSHLGAFFGKMLHSGSPGRDMPPTTYSSPAILSSCIGRLLQNCSLVHGSSRWCSLWETGAMIS